MQGLYIICLVLESEMKWMTWTWGMELQKRKKKNTIKTHMYIIVLHTYSSFFSESVDLWALPFK